MADKKGKRNSKGKEPKKVLEPVEEETGDQKIYIVYFF
jgi:hypothetical protein